MKKIGEKLLLQTTIDKLTRINNVLILVAICSRMQWLILAALVFWCFLLLVLIRRDHREKAVSSATIAYGLIFCAVVIYCIISLFK